MTVFRKNGRLGHHGEFLFGIFSLQVEPVKRYYMRKIATQMKHIATMSGDASEIYTRELLDAYKVQYTEGNDAVKGGKIGNYFDIKKDEKLDLFNPYSSVYLQVNSPMNFARRQFYMSFNDIYNDLVSTKGSIEEVYYAFVNHISSRLPKEKKPGGWEDCLRDVLIGRLIEHARWPQYEKVALLIGLQNEAEDLLHLEQTFQPMVKNHDLLTILMQAKSIDAACSWLWGLERPNEALHPTHRQLLTKIVREYALNLSITLQRKFSEGIREELYVEMVSDRLYARKVINALDKATLAAYLKSARSVEEIANDIVENTQLDMSEAPLNWPICVKDAIVDKAKHLFRHERFDELSKEVRCSLGPILDHQDILKKAITLEELKELLTQKQSLAEVVKVITERALRTYYREELPKRWESWVAFHIKSEIIFKSRGLNQVSDLSPGILAEFGILTSDAQFVGQTTKSLFF